VAKKIKGENLVLFIAQEKERKEPKRKKKT